jgi:purine nucleosidase
MREFVIDCDGGCDDALALLWLLGSGYRVGAVTTVRGNVSAAVGAAAMRAVADAAGGSGIPVVAGAPLSLAGTSLPATHVHGRSGLGGIVLPTPEREPPGAGEAVRTLLDLSTKDEPVERVLLCLGPLTNIALACSLDRDFLTRFSSVVVMGGTLDGTGNATELAEFNLHADAEAARVVLGAPGLPAFVGLDTVRSSGLLPEEGWRTVLDRVPAGWRAVLDAVSGPLLDWTACTDGPGLLGAPDLLAAVVAARPELASAGEHVVGVEVDGPARGLVFDDPGGGRVRWVDRVDGEAVLDAVGRGLAALPALQVEHPLRPTPVATG